MNTEEDIQTKKNTGYDWSTADEPLLQRIDDLSSLQRSLDVSDAVFVSRSGVSSTVWLRLKARTYPGKVHEVLAKLEQHVILHRAAMRNVQASLTFKFVTTPAFEQLQGALSDLDKCMLLGDRDRFVWILARTGWGKSAIIEELRKARPGSVSLRLKESWKSSYFGFMKQLANEVDLRQPRVLVRKGRAGGKDEYAHRPWRGEEELETALIDRLRLQPKLFFVDEFEYMSRRVLHLLRVLANETGCAFVIACLPESYRALFAAHTRTHTEQLASRTLFAVCQDQITADITRQFLAQIWPEFPGMDDAAELLTTEAMRFGGIWKIRRALETLASMTRQAGRKVPSVKLMQDAIDHVSDVTLVRLANAA